MKYSRRPPNIYDPCYRRIIGILIDERKKAGLNQQQVAEATGMLQGYISYVETFQRRADILEILKIVDAVSKGKKSRAKELWAEIQDEYYKSKKRK